MTRELSSDTTNGEQGKEGRTKEIKMTYGIAKGGIQTHKAGRTG